MQLESADSDRNPPRSSRTDWQLTALDSEFDRRAVIRGAGSVFVASALAGCYHDGGGDGDGDGGGYSLDDPRESKR